jgi:hypothetical protein
MGIEETSSDMPHKSKYVRQNTTAPTITDVLVGNVLEYLLPYDRPTDRPNDRMDHPGSTTTHRFMIVLLFLCSVTLLRRTPHICVLGGVFWVHNHHTSINIY